ncbi:thioredoxin-like domain-containing protein [Brevibacillus brevis]|nr:thioredoxin-like domain-containing protein [Brevibacillus brevis]
MIEKASLLSLWIMVLIQTVLFTIILYQIRSKNTVKSGIPTGLAMPQISIADEFGEENNFLNITRNKMTMFCFANHECMFCKQVIPELDRFSSLHPEINIMIISLGDEESRDLLIKKTLTRLPVFRTSEREVRKRVKIRNFPYGFVLDGDGIIQKQGVIKKDNLLNWLDAFANQVNENEVIDLKTN